MKKSLLPFFFLLLQLRQLSQQTKAFMLALHLDGPALTALAPTLP